jgi:hypothetical protein
MHNKLVEAALAWRHADMKSALIYLEEIDGDPDEAICFVEGHKTGITTEYLRAVR